MMRLLRLLIDEDDDMLPRALPRVPVQHIIMI